MLNDLSDDRVDVFEAVADVVVTAPTFTKFRMLPSDIIVAGLVRVRLINENIKNNLLISNTNTNNP